MSVDSDILGVIETEVISDGMCLWSTDKVVLSSFGLLGTPSHVSFAAEAKETAFFHSCFVFFWCQLS